MTTITHEDVLAAAARGDDEALTVLIRAYHDRVYRFGLRVCHDSFDADDAVQEAFIKLARRPDVVTHQGALSWLFSVVRNACLRMFRRLGQERRSLGQRIHGEEISTDAVNPQQALERWELVRTVHAGIASLDRPYREVLIMRDLERLSGDETCVALGLESATMKTRLHRARRQLRDWLIVRIRPGP